MLNGYLGSDHDPLRPTRRVKSDEGFFPLIRPETHIPSFLARSKLNKKGRLVPKAGLYQKGLLKSLKIWAITTLTPSCLDVLLRRLSPELVDHPNTNLTSGCNRDPGAAGILTPGVGLSTGWPQAFHLKRSHNASTMRPQAMYGIVIRREAYPLLQLEETSTGISDQFLCFRQSGIWGRRYPEV
jgi:hypothetical protein